MINLWDVHELYKDSFKQRNSEDHLSGYDATQVGR
jgi:hypothetical protein